MIVENRDNLILPRDSGHASKHIRGSKKRIIGWAFLTNFPLKVGNCLPIIQTFTLDRI